MVTYISADERAEKVMENQSVIRQPIVRNGRQATVGYAPDVWKTWKWYYREISYDDGHEND